MTDVATPTPTPGVGPGEGRRRVGPVAGGWPRAVPYLGVVPFLALRRAVPGVADVHRRRPARSRTTPGRPTTSQRDGGRSAAARTVDAFVRSIELSVVTALVGAVLGALLAWAVAEGRPGGLLRRLGGRRGRACWPSSAASCWRSRSSPRSASTGVVTLFLADTSRRRPARRRLLALRADRPRRGLHLLPDPADADRVPAGDRRAPATVAGGVGQPRRHRRGRTGGTSAVPSSRPLHRRDAAAVRQRVLRVRDGGGAGQPGQPDGDAADPHDALTSEVVLGQANVGKALALGMVIVVAVVMTLYALLQRRTARWLR